MREYPLKVTTRLRRGSILRLFFAPSFEYTATVCDVTENLVTIDSVFSVSGNLPIPGKFTYKINGLTAGRNPRVTVSVPFCPKREGACS